MTGRERLERLANVILPNVKEGEFNLLDWKCGSVACAVGHACFDPIFREEGLLFVGCPLFMGLYTWPGVRLFFEISHKNASHLFCYVSYPESDRTNPLAVAERIREFLNKGEST